MAEPPEHYLLEDHEVQVFRDLLVREQKTGSYPDSEDMKAMEEPLCRLMGAVLLFTDLATESRREDAPQALGLSFLAQAMNREVTRLFRLYHGHPPQES